MSRRIAQPADDSRSKEATYFDESMAYERGLDRDLRWAMGEGDRYFNEKSLVWDTLRRIVTRLKELRIPFAVYGDLAMFKHGYRQFTEIVELLTTQAGLRDIHSKLVGNGYCFNRPHSKHLRDAETGVKIELRITGEHPGDGRAKPVAFPDPSVVAVDIGGIPYVSLSALIELKLVASFPEYEISQGLCDVHAMIRVLKLPASLCENLHPCVQGKYMELWDRLQGYVDPHEQGYR